MAFLGIGRRDDSLRIKVNEAQLAHLKSILSPKQFTQVVVGALNRTARTGAVMVRDRLAPYAFVPKKVLGSGDRGMVRPILANYTTLRAGIRILNFNIPYNRITGAKIGVRGRYALSKTGKVETTDYKSWQVNRVVRKAGGVRADKSQPIFVRLRSTRLPIKKLWAPSPRKVFEAAPAVRASVMAQLGPILQKNIASQVNRRLNRKKGEALTVSAEGIGATSGEGVGTTIVTGG